MVARKSTRRCADKVPSPLVRTVTGAVAAAAILGIFAPTPARAACQPNPATSGQTVTCTGNDPNGFVADPGVDTLTVRVGPNATVHDNNGTAAISVNDNNVINNRGTIIEKNSPFGILAGDNNVIRNSGEIKAGATGTGIFVANNNTVRKPAATSPSVKPELRSSASTPIP